MEGFFDRPHDDPRGLTCSQKQLCSILGLDRKSVNEYQASGLPFKPRSGPGESNSYNVAAVMRWLHLREIGAEGGESAHALLARAKTTLIELEIAQKRGALIPANQIEAGWTMILAAVRAGVLAIPTLADELDITPGIEPKRALLEQRCRDVLTELASGRALDFDANGEAAGTDA